MRCARAGGAGESEMAYRKNDGGNFSALLAMARARMRAMVDGRWRRGRSVRLTETLRAQDGGARGAYQDAHEVGSYTS